jgi:hypothetical protein
MPVPQTGLSTNKKLEGKGIGLNKLIKIFFMPIIFVL